MTDDVMQREQLSALADGALAGDELAQALQWAGTEQGQATWKIYHLVGDVLRSPELAEHGRSPMVARLREQLALDARPGAAVESIPAVGPVLQQRDAAANDSVFRWKMVAGFASLAAVAALGWGALTGLQGGDASGTQLASAPAPARSAAPVVAMADKGEPQQMLRDPRLDELLAAHQQFGSTAALQMPAGFLRNASFETAGR